MVESSGVNVRPACPRIRHRRDNPDYIFNFEPRGPSVFRSFGVISATDCAACKSLAWICRVLVKVRDRWACASRLSADLPGLSMGSGNADGSFVSRRSSALSVPSHSPPLLGIGFTPAQMSSTGFLRVLSHIPLIGEPELSTGA
jgi:hypothetical protein